MSVLTQRWVLTDPSAGDSWTMPINPDSMTSPFPQRTYEFAQGAAQTRARATMSLPTGVDWQFGGAIRTQSHHDTLRAWVRRPGKMHLTDHLGRTFELMFSSFDVTDKTPTPRTQWRMRYVVKATVLRQL